MNSMWVNSSTTSVNAIDESVSYEYSEEYNHFLMALELLGISGNVMVFLVAWHAVTVEKKNGNT